MAGVGRKERKANNLSQNYLLLSLRLGVFA
jgi:hypothetical protein